MEAIETYIVNFTSPAARSPLLSVPENGKAAALKILWISTSQTTSYFVSGPIATPANAANDQMPCATPLAAI